MASMSTTAGPGGASQSTVTTPGLAIQNPNDFLRFAYAMALQRRQRQAQQQQQAAALAPRSESSSPTRAPEHEAYYDQSPLDRQLEAATKRKAIIEADEATRPMPLTFLPSGPGITGGYVSDPRAMDANQRKLFLPQQSNMAPADTAAIDRDAAAARDPLADKYSNAYRDMVSRGLTPAEIASIRVQQLAAKQGGR